MAHCHFLASYYLHTMYAFPSLDLRDKRAIMGYKKFIGACIKRSPPPECLTLWERYGSHPMATRKHITLGHVLEESSFHMDRSTSSC